MQSARCQQTAPEEEMKREFLEQVGAILQLQPNTLNGTEALASQGWDSIAVIAFQALLDERSGIRMDCGRIAACDTFDDLFQLMQVSVNHESAD